MGYNDEPQPPLRWPRTLDCNHFYAGELTYILSWNPAEAYCGDRAGPGDCCSFLTFSNMSIPQSSLSSRLRNLDLVASTFILTDELSI